MQYSLRPHQKYPFNNHLIWCSVLCLLILYSSVGAGVFVSGGRFESAGSASAVVTADFDNDADIDIAVAQRDDDTIYVHLNDGAGNFGEILKLRAARDGGLGTADLNNDGYYDLLIYDEGWIDDDWGITVYLNNGDSSFTRLYQDTIGSPYFTIADFNGDDVDDIAVYNYLQENPGIWIYSGLGNGDFASPVFLGPATIGLPLAGDLDNDGDMDLLYRVGAVAYCRLNNGDGSFAEQFDSQVGSSMGELKEMNGDQYPDLLRRETYGCSGHPVYLPGNGDGTFGAPQTAWITAGLLSGIDLVAADFSNDGYVDIALYAPETKHIQVGLNDGRMDFESFQENVSMSAGGRNLATADFDGDGDYDLAVIGNDSTLEVAFSVGAQHSWTHVVPNDYPSIQEAVDAAWNLDAIHVCPGTYYGSIDFGGKSLVLLAADCAGRSSASGPGDWVSQSSATILDGGGIGRVLTFDDFEDDRSVVSGFTIQNGYAYGLGGGIYCYDTASPTIINNIIRDNHATAAGGGVFVHTGAVTIKNNLIVFNSSENLGGGLYVGSGTILLNTIYGNSAEGGGGGLYYSYGDPTISSNIFWANGSTAGGQQIGYSSNAPTIIYSDIQGGWPGDGNQDEDPMFVDAGNNNFNLLEGSPCIDAADPNLPLDPDGSFPDIGAFYYSHPVDVDDEGTEILPYQFHLSQNYPNPSNPTTTITYDLPRRAEVRIDIYNLLGQLVTTLVDCEQPAGSYSAMWDGTSSSGETAATGVYLYRFRAGEYVETKKMVLLK
jgi:hypothetical protein